MNTQDIGSFIAAKRREQNLTQEQLAERIGVSNKTVSKWETGKCMPDYSVIELLCKQLNITIGELLAGKEMEDETIKDFNENQLALLLYKAKQNHEYEHKHNGHIFDEPMHKGITFGSVLAIVISYTHWHSIGWAIFHGLMSWGYVIYYLIKY